MEKETIIQRLEGFGYAYTEADDFPLEFMIEKVTNYIMHVTNQPNIPEGLNNVAVDMVCGEFLRMQKGFGKIDSIQVETMASNIKLGDTTVQFTEPVSPEKQFDAAVEYLITGHVNELLCFRKLVW